MPLWSIKNNKHAHHQPPQQQQPTPTYMLLLHPLLNRDADATMLKLASSSCANGQTEGSYTPLEHCKLLAWVHVLTHHTHHKRPYHVTPRPALPFLCTDPPLGGPCRHQGVGGSTLCPGVFLEPVCSKVNEEATSPMGPLSNARRMRRPQPPSYSRWPVWGCSPISLWCSLF